MPKQFITELKKGMRASSVFSVKYKEPMREYGKPFKGYMFSLGLSDKTGEISLNFFGSTDRASVQNVYDGFVVGDVVFVDGNVSEFNGRLNVNTSPPEGTVRKALETEYNIGDYVAETNQNVDEMMQKIDEARAGIKNPHLKALLDSFFNDADFVKAYRTTPAAMYMHHNCIGGLLEHNWGVLQLCEVEAKIHPSLDCDLLFCGAILHDIGKIAEFETTTHIKVSEEGMLRGHSSIGEEMILEKIRKIEGFPRQLKLKIVHMIIAHHGKKDNGCAKEPQFPEAYALYAADEFDAKITQYIRIKKDANTEDFRVYTKRLGEIYLK